MHYSTHTHTRLRELVGAVLALLLLHQAADAGLIMQIMRTPVFRFRSLL